MSVERLDPAQLLSRVVARDREAFQALYRLVSPKLYGITLRILRRHDLAEEALQEIFIRVWNKAGHFDIAAGTPHAWLSAIARNCALDLRRRRQESSIEDEPAVAALADGADDPLTLAERSDALQQLARCLDTLDPEKRRIVLLAYLDGLSREELSVQFDVPIGTIKTWLHRSLARLKECLGT